MAGATGWGADLIGTPDPYPADGPPSGEGDGEADDAGGRPEVGTTGAGGIIGRLGGADIGRDGGGEDGAGGGPGGGPTGGPGGVERIVGPEIDASVRIVGPERDVSPRDDAPAELDDRLDGAAPTLGAAGGAGGKDPGRGAFVRTVGA